MTRLAMKTKKEYNSPMSMSFQKKGGFYIAQHGNNVGIGVSPSEAIYNALYPTKEVLISYVEEENRSPDGAFIYPEAEWHTARKRSVMSKKQEKRTLKPLPPCKCPSMDGESRYYDCEDNPQSSSIPIEFTE